MTLSNQAVLLSEKLDRPQDALPLATEAHHLAAEHGFTDLAGHIKAILDMVRWRLILKA